MSLETVEDLLGHELKDLYSAESQLIKALPKMAKAATTPELKEAFEEHLQQTKQHVERIEQICRNLGINPKGKKCVGMEGLVEEGSEIIGKDGDEVIRDMALIGAAQRVEHYEIASYGTARALAEKLGEDEAAEMLQQTLDEESATDEKLTEIAESFEVEEGEEEEGEDEEEDEEYEEDEEEEEE